MAAIDPMPMNLGLMANAMMIMIVGISRGDHRQRAGGEHQGEDDFFHGIPQ
jgi:hypothetical protein